MSCFGSEVLLQGDHDDAAPRPLRPASRRSRRRRPSCCASARRPWRPASRQSRRRRPRPSRPARGDHDDAGLRRRCAEAMADSKPIFLDASPELMHRFIHPFSMAIIGQTMVGKSYLISQILKFKSQLMTTHFDAIYYCLPSHLHEANRDYIEELKKLCPEIRILDSEPNLSLIRDNHLPRLFILESIL